MFIKLKIGWLRNGEPNRITIAYMKVKLFDFDRHNYYLIINHMTWKKINSSINAIINLWISVMNTTIYIQKLIFRIKKKRLSSKKLRYIERMFSISKFYVEKGDLIFVPSLEISISKIVWTKLKEWPSGAQETAWLAKFESSVGWTSTYCRNISD